MRGKLKFRLFEKPWKTSIQKKLNDFSQRKEDVFFIQIGSNDGVTRDPLNRHIVKHHWRGIVIEPVRYIYEKLVQTYKHEPGVQCENVAIAEVNGTKEFYRLKESSDGLPEWYDQLGSFYPDIVQAHRHKIKDFDTYYITEPVDCITWDGLLEKYGVKTIDLLHIDTEGYDFEILKMLNFKMHKPEFILFEHKHLPITTYRKAIYLLKNNGYKLRWEKNDTLAMLPK